MIKSSRPAAATASPDSQWPTFYGPHWRVKLLILATLLVVRGALETLGDADLPLHLALGEWIISNRQVPYIEPFAWTRAGSPYYSYSWLPQIIYYLLSESGGKIALRVFHGLTLAGAGASMLALGRAARWDPRTSLLMAAMNVTVMSVLVAAVRPQGLLFTLIPLAWACTYRALAPGRQLAALAGLAVVGAAAANTHIFFPLTAAPWMLWIVASPRDRRRIFAIVAVTLAGWLASPYALNWPAVFGSNAPTNLLLVFPSPISEVVPGFLAVRLNFLAVVLGVCLAVLPWLNPAPQLAPRARLVFGAAWLAGLILFAGAFRLLIVWWMLVLPLASSAIFSISQKLLASEEREVRLLRLTAVWAVCAGLILSPGRFEADAWRAEDPAGGRTFAPSSESGLEQIARWLDCNVRAGTGGRVFTFFDYGSALTWRLPGYSMSIDGRTIFPDSVAASEAFYDPSREPLRVGPWRTADLAIMPAPSAVSEILDRAPGWRRAAIAHRKPGSIALWVSDRWWFTAGNGFLPPQPTVLDAAYACASRPSMAR